MRIFHLLQAWNILENAEELGTGLSRAVAVVCGRRPYVETPTPRWWGPGGCRQAGSPGEARRPVGGMLTVTSGGSQRTVYVYWQWQLGWAKRILRVAVRSCRRPVQRNCNRGPPERRRGCRAGQSAGRKPKLRAEDRLADRPSSAGESVPPNRWLVDGSWWCGNGMIRGVARAAWINSTRIEPPDPWWLQKAHQTVRSNRSRGHSQR